MRRDRQRLIRWGLLTAAGLVFVLLFRGSLAGVIAVVQRPLVAAGTWIGARVSWAFDPSSLSSARAAQLTAERDAAAVDRAELEQLRSDNQELRDALGYVTRRHDASVTAAIVSRSVGPDASTIVIDRGTDDRVTVGLPALSGDGILVGKVISATAGTATVRVISDRISATAVTLLNETRTIGIAQGLSGALLSLQYIPQDESIAVNDIVVTSGLEDGIPSGLLVGMVNSVETDPTAPFQQAVIEPLADVRRVSSVTVLIPIAPST